MGPGLRAWSWTVALTSAAALALLYTVTTSNPGVIPISGDAPAAVQQPVGGAGGGGGARHARGKSGGGSGSGAGDEEAATALLSASGVGGGGAVVQRGGGGGAGGGSGSAGAGAGGGEARGGRHSASHLKALDSPALWAGNWAQLCVSCRIVRPLRAKHCSMTNRCIEVRVVIRAAQRGPAHSAAPPARRPPAAQPQHLRPSPSTLHAPPSAQPPHPLCPLPSLVAAASLTRQLLTGSPAGV